jgi:hypothetical protein
MNRIVAALLLCACAASASAQTAAPAAAPEPGPSPAADPDADPDIVVSGEKPKKVCRTERATGSIMPKRICRTAEQVAAEQAAALRSKDYMQSQQETVRETQIQRLGT